MPKRYIAVHGNLPWGPKHLAAGEELIDPPPTVDGAEGTLLREIHLKSGAVREMTEKEISDRRLRAAGGNYQRRDMTAETRSGGASRSNDESRGRAGTRNAAVDQGAMVAKESKDDPEKPESKADKPDAAG